MTTKRKRLIVVVAAALVLLVAGALLITGTQAQLGGQVVEFNGHLLRLDGAHTVVIESSMNTTTWGGVRPITQTTSIVTVTVYRR